MTEDVLYLALAPSALSTVPTLFRDVGVRQVIESPPSLRAATVGWDLQTLDRARIVEGKKLRVDSGDRQALELSEDGSFISLASLSEFLGWPRGGRHFSMDPQINSVGLIELLYNFGLTYHALLGYIAPTPDEVLATVGVRGAEVGESSVYLRPGMSGMPGRFPEGGHAAPEPTWDSPPLRFQIHPQSRDDSNAFAARLGFLLAASLYHWFGLTDDEIPFADADKHQLEMEVFLAEVRR